jgi:hypothetical protein
MLRDLATEATTQETAVTRVSATSRAGRLQDRKTEQSGIPNRTIWFPQRQQKLQCSHTNNQYKDRRMLGVWEAIKIR